VSRWVGALPLLLAYFPARFIWDISGEHTRGLWAFVGLLVLVGAAAALVAQPWRDRP
jgi:uncharacterized membrane protein YhaH (DUF805 family)